MINQLGRYILSLVFIILIQVMILNNLNFGGYVNPFIYLLFILILPVEIPNWFLLFLGFFLGIIMDIFLNTLGLHTSATLFISFLRPYYLQAIAPREGYEPNSEPTASHFGFAWFAKYVSIMVVTHHLFLFFVEAFTFSTFFTTIWKVIVSSFTTLIILFIVSMFTRNSKKRF